MSAQRTALCLGLLGIVPFVGFVIAAWATPKVGLSFTFLQAEIDWAAIILAFMAGARWAFILMQGTPEVWRVMTFGLFPALSLAAPFLPFRWAVLLLAAGFTLLLVSELMPGGAAKRRSGIRRCASS